MDYEIRELKLEDIELGDLIEQSHEYPLLIRGTSAEEAVWLLGLEGRGFYSTPTKIYAFPIIEGFAKARIQPIKPIPSNYTLMKLRDEVLEAPDIGDGGCFGPSLFNYGNVDKWKDYMADEGRIGVILYFNSRAISNGYRQDTKCKDRLHLLCSVVIRIKGDFHKDSVVAVEPLGPTDSRIIQEHGYEQRLQTRFKNRREYRDYCEENKGRITFERGGQHFPR